MSKKDLTKHFIYSRIIITILFLLAGTINNSFSDLFLIFDGEHYFNIAFNGYTLDYLYAFFPLFPLVIKLFSFISTNIIFLGVSIYIFNNIATYISSIYLYKLIDKYYLYNKKLLYNIWLYSPVALFTIIPYTEALFIMFTILAFYFYIEKKNYLLIGIMLGLSVATRSTGSLLFFAIFIGMVIKKEKFMNIIKTYIPATIISCLYPLYLHITTGNWNKFITVQYDEWGKVKSNIFDVFISDCIKFLISDSILIKIAIFIILLVFGFAFYLMIKNTIKTARSKDIAYLELLIYTVLTFITICSTKRSMDIQSPSGTSLHRYITAMFSLYLILPSKEKYLKIIFSVSSILTIIICIFMGLGLFIG